jgi:terminase large subunit-like protein
MSRYVVQAGWDHAPHLTEEAKQELLAAIPPHEREARRNGTPTLGSGKIYEIPESDFVIDDFAVPAFWFKCYALDVGWNRTAGIWLAEDRESGIAYAYSEHYASEAVPAVHAAAIKGRGDWIPGVIDPAAKGRSQIDGERLIELYLAEGLRLDPADNSVEAGIYAVRQRLLSGKLKVFRSLVNLLAEYRLYRRDEKGKVVKIKDHALDGLRYAVMSGLAVAKQPPVKRTPYSTGSRLFSG